MAKKKEERVEPVVSSIPVPPSDSALVIDLPDGQKLLVGKIETGTVIEVATWRGTGRPDSRTNRLMLGMSNENDVKPSESSDDGSNRPPAKVKFPNNVPLIASGLFRRIVQISKVSWIKVVALAKDASKSGKFKLPKKSSFKSPEIRESLKVEDDFDIDFQRILDEVSNKRAAKSKVTSDSPLEVTKSKGGINSKRSKGVKAAKPSTTRNKGRNKSK